MKLIATLAASAILLGGADAYAAADPALAAWQCAALAGYGGLGSAEVLRLAKYAESFPASVANDGIESGPFAVLSVGMDTKSFNRAASISLASEMVTAALNPLIAQTGSAKAYLEAFTKLSASEYDRRNCSLIGR